MKKKPFFTKTSSFTWRRELRLYREDKDIATRLVFWKRCDFGEYSLRIKIWWAVCKRSAWWNINKLPSLNYHYSLCLSAESCLQNKKLILLYFRRRIDGNNLIGKVNLIENRPVKLHILFYNNADKTDLLRTSWNNLDPILKSLLHALNIVFYFANEVTNVTVHCVGKYKLAGYL